MESPSIKNRFKLLRKRPLHRFKIFLKYHLKKSEKDPIFIITARRTGSNLLLSYLNSIPNVSFAHEILNKDMSYGLRSRFISKKAVLNHILYSIHNCEHRICGTKLVRVQLENHKLEIEGLRKIFPKAKFIILYRKLLLEQYVSLRIAEITNTWSRTEDFQLPSSIYIDRSALEMFCASVRNFYEDILSNVWLKERSILISYEELVSEPQFTFNTKVFPFIRLPSFPLSTHLVKQNTKKPQEIIKNFEEIRDIAGESLNLEREGVDETGFTLNGLRGFLVPAKTTLANPVNLRGQFLEP